MLEFVDSGLYFIQDENSFINPLLQVGFRSWAGSNEKSTGSGSGGPKINRSDRILIPEKNRSRINNPKPTFVEQGDEGVLDLGAELGTKRELGPLPVQRGSHLLQLPKQG